jgi:hypothetical protein
MTKGVGGLSLAFKSLALSMLPATVAIAGIALLIKPAALLVHEVVSVMKGDIVQAIDASIGLLGFMEQLKNIPFIGTAGQFAGLAGVTESLKKIKANLEGVTIATHDVSPALQGLDNDALQVNKTFDQVVNSITGVITGANNAEAALPPVGTAIVGVGTDAAGASPAVDGLGTSIDGASTSFATMYKAIGPATIGIAGLDARMNPFRVTLQGVTAAQQSESDALKFLTTWLNTAVSSTNAFEASTARAKQQAAQLGPVLDRATKSLQRFTGASGGSGKPQPQFGPMHGNPIQGAANPNFRLKPDWQKAKIVKAQSGMHETVNQPTWILAGESGKERVDIGKGGGGGFSGTINVYVDGVWKDARYKINENQGVFK